MLRLKRFDFTLRQDVALLAFDRREEQRTGNQDKVETL